MSPPPQIQYTAPPQPYGALNPGVAQGAAQPLHARNISEDGISSLPSQRPGRVQRLDSEPAPSPATASVAARSANPSPSPQPTAGWMVSPLPTPQVNGNVDRERAVSPESTVQGTSSPKHQLTTPTQRVAEDNLYDATPRQSQFPVQQQQPQLQSQSPPPQAQSQFPVQQQQPQFQVQSQPQPRQQYNEAVNQPSFTSPSPPPPQLVVTPHTIVINGPVEPKSAGLSHEVTRPRLGLETPEPPAQQHTSSDVDHSHDDDLDFDSDMESPIIQDAAIATVQQASPSTSPTAQNGGLAAKDNVAIFERAKRKAEEEREAEMRLVLEEKIPVFSEQDEAAAAASRRREEEKPQMSATSYPGQEWNPYGEGGFEEWE